MNYSINKLKERITMETNTIKPIEDNITIREYEGWSANNTTNSIYFKTGIGHIVFVSYKEINELETLGVYHIAKHQTNIYIKDLT